MQIDLDGRHLGNRYPVEVGLAGDAGRRWRRCCRCCGSGRRPWRTEVEARGATRGTSSRSARADAGRPLNPELVVREPDRRLPGGRPGQRRRRLGRLLVRPAPRAAAGRAGAPLRRRWRRMGSRRPLRRSPPSCAHPDRPVVALVGDGAMQMNGIAELITVADRWRGWTDPRFVVCVLQQPGPRRGDLGAARDGGRAAVRRQPGAAGLPLRGVRRAARPARHPGRPPEEVGAAWEAALAADRPVVIEAVVDPDVPLLPPFPAGAARSWTCSAGRSTPRGTGRARPRAARRAGAAGGRVSGV